MGTHLFISYSRKDQSYVRKLADHLREQRFEVWIDDRIDYGDRWWRTIVQAIRECAAFLLVMTPDSEESDWVEKEILLASDEKKPIVPLLLRGKVNPLCINRQAVDVTGGALPPKELLQRLRQFFPTPRPVDPAAVEKALALFALAAPKLSAEHKLFGRYLQWSAAPGALNYVLERSVDANFSKPLEVYRGGETHFWDMQFASGLLLTPSFFGQPGAFYYRVKATSLLRSSPWSNVVKIDPPKYDQLPAPKLEYKPASFGLGHYSMVGALGWSAVTGADSYLLQQSSDEHFTAPAESYRGDKTTYYYSRPSFSVSLLVTPVYFRVRASGTNFRDSPWSNVVKVESTPLLLMAPVLEEAEQGVLKWTPVLGAKEYVVERSADAQFQDSVEIYRGETLSHSERPLFHLFSYYYRVKAVRRDGLDSPWSKPIRLGGKGA